MKIQNPPLANDLMATVRSLGGYDLAAALADLIDNSIKAKAKRVDVSFFPSLNDVIVRVRDDGVGMNKRELITAMRPASANPNALRASDDLGRFGWGLKSASFSQARALTVVSWQAESASAAQWDIDDIDDWGMEIHDGSKALSYLNGPALTETGTEVIWTKSDRLLDLENCTSIDDLLTPSIDHAMRKLSLIFHRYLAGEGGRRIIISVNGNTLTPVDPFLTTHDATQTLDAEDIAMASGEKIRIQPYILPHFSKLSTEEQAVLGGAEGMVRNQGFYVYRNRRLIIHGTWFRIVPHGELTQLTRVKVDLPNSVDADWRITIDKSDAQLPSFLRRRLQEIVRRFNQRSARVHRNKGISLDRKEIQPVWRRLVKNGQVSYIVNREHPMVAKLIGDQMVCDEFSGVLRLLESYFPSDFLIKDAAAGVQHSSNSLEDFEGLLDQCMINYLRMCDGAPNVRDFLAYISRVEPFCTQWAYTESYVMENIFSKWGVQNGF